MPDAQGDQKGVSNPLKLELLPVELNPGSLQEHGVVSMAEQVSGLADNAICGEGSARLQPRAWETAGGIPGVHWPSR